VNRHQAPLRDRTRSRRTIQNLDRHDWQWKESVNYIHTRISLEKSTDRLRNTDMPQRSGGSQTDIPQSASYIRSWRLELLLVHDSLPSVYNSSLCDPVPRRSCIFYGLSPSLLSTVDGILYLPTEKWTRNYKKRAAWK
jgi:hypothetical protein